MGRGNCSWDYKTGLSDYNLPVFYNCIILECDISESNYDF